MHSKIFDRLSFLTFFLIIILLPIFFLPFTRIPIEASKGLLLVVGLSVGIIFWIIARFLDGRIVLPKSWLLVSGFGVVLTFLLSALFSGNPKVSLFGTMFDIGSFWFIFSAFILMLFSSIVFRTPKQAKMVLFGTIVSSVLVLIFQGVHLFFPTITSMGVLTTKTANVLGSWNALGLFAGFASLMFLLVVEFFSISRIEKLLLQIFLLLSVLLLVSVNFPLVWILLGVSSLVIFVYKVSISFQKDEKEENGKKKYFPFTSFIICIISLIFFLNPLIPLKSKQATVGNINPTENIIPLGDIVPNFLQVSSTEVSPSFESTMSVIKAVLIKDPLLGIGPNKFGEAWSMYKPVSINSTQFWDVFFNSGSGLLPTLVSTTGGLGILALLIFSILFLIIGVKSVFLGVKKETNWGIMAFFVLSFYLFVSSFFYSTGPVIFLLSLAFTGVFIGLTASSSNKEISMSFLNDHRKSFFSILILILVVILSIAASFKYVERFISISYFNKALTAPTVALAQESIDKTLKLYVNDLYLRTYAQIYLVKLDSMVRKMESLSETEKQDLQTILDQAVKGALLATTYNETNYLNFKMLGSLYESLVALGVTDKNIYNKTIEAYKTASTLNPNNPGLKLSLATVSFADGKIKEAKDYANLALSLKPDYVDALITLSQIAKSEGDNALALSYAQRASLIVPNNADLMKYIDSLKNPIIVQEPKPDLESNSAPDSAPVSNKKKP